MSEIELVHGDKCISESGQSSTDAAIALFLIVVAIVAVAVVCGYVPECW